LLPRHCLDQSVLSDSSAKSIINSDAVSHLTTIMLGDSNDMPRGYNDVANCSDQNDFI
jgi:hypothetical protein